MVVSSVCRNDFYDIYGVEVDGTESKGTLAFGTSGANNSLRN